jgi:hypothetical protein
MDLMVPGWYLVACKVVVKLIGPAPERKGLARIGRRPDLIDWGCFNRG